MTRPTSMPHATRFRCTACGTDQFLPERPLTCPLSVRAGCDHCDRIVRHEAVGKP